MHFCKLKTKIKNPTPDMRRKHAWWGLPEIGPATFVLTSGSIAPAHFPNQSVSLDSALGQAITGRAVPHAPTAMEFILASGLNPEKDGVDKLREILNG